MLRFMALLYSIFGLLAVLLIFRRPKEKKIEKILDINESLTLLKTSLNPNEHIKSLRQCTRSIRFWQFISMLILTNYYNTFFGNVYKSYGQSIG